MRAGLLGALLCLALAAPGLGQNIWTGAAGTTNWSTDGNWSYGRAPLVSDLVAFDLASPAVAAGVIDNIVDNNFSIYNLFYQTVSTNGFHTTLIPANLALTLTGGGGETIFVGTGGPVNGSVSVYDRIVGPGSLTVADPGGVIDIVQGGDNNDHFATLDLAGLTNFTASIAQIFVGCISNTTTSGLRPMGILRLAETNSITTPAGTSVPGILIASYPTGDTNLRGTQQMLLGRHNIFNVDAISIGGTKSTGQISVRLGVTEGFVSLRGSAGPSDKVKILAVGDGRAGMFNYNPGGTSAGNTGTFNSTGLLLDAMIQDLYVSRTQTNGSGSATGTLTLDHGSIVTDNLFVGYHTTGIGPAIAANATGTVNVNGDATITVNNDLILSRKLGSSTPVATLNISTNAMVNVKGNVVSSGGNGTINLNQGTLDLQPAGDPAAGYVSVSTISGSGFIFNAAAVTNTAALTPGTTASLGVLNIDNNLTLNTGASVNLNLPNSPASGNDLVNVSGNLVLNSNNVVLVPLDTSLAVGTYPFITYAGTRTGFLNITNPTRYNLGLTYPPNAVALTVSGGGPGSVRWNGTTSGVWDGVLSNWFNTSSLATDKFFMLDNVLLDGSGTLTNTLLLSGQLFPSSVTVNASTRDYTMAGSGRISGAAGLVKSGTSMLTISNQNDFSGPVMVNGGTLRLGSGSAVGTAAGGVFVANNATLDLYGTNVGSDLVTISGTGLNNTGAVINTGLRQDNAIRLLSLATDATVGTYGLGRWDVRGAGGNSSFSGSLDLSGYTLTKMGSTQFSVVDCIVTNAGSIEVLGGNLAPTRSKVDGPGYVNIHNNMLFFENSSTGYFAKPVIVDGGIIRVTGNPSSIWAPITNLAGGLNIDNSQTFTVTNVITGPGGLTKSSGANLILQAAETYTGPTLVAAGRLTLDTNASIATTPSIALASGTVLDATAVPGGLVLSSGQALSGSGTVLGDVDATAGNSVVPGTSAGTLSFSNSLSLANASTVFELNADPTVIGSNYNDLIVVSNTLTLSGMNNIKIAPLASLSNGWPYTLFLYNNLVGGAGNLTVGSDSRYTFSLVDPGSTPGQIQVNVTGDGASANLLWKGGASGNPNTWDTKVTTNWLNGLSPDVFYLGDNVLFDDTASTPNVTLAGTEQPAAVAITNSSQSYNFSGGGSLLAGSLTKDGSAAATFANSAANTISGPLLLAGGSLTFANSGANTFASGATVNGGSLVLANAGLDTFTTPLFVNGGSVVFNQAADTIFGSVLADNGVSSGTVQKLGANMLTVSANNTNFNGPIVVSGGTLRANNTYALGSAVAGTTIATGATLDINGVSLYNPGDEITVSGTGVGGQGAIINTGGNQNNALRALTLAGNTTVAAPTARWDVRGPGGSGSFSGALNLNGFTLTKNGPAQISIVDSTVSTPGSIIVNGGLLSLTRCNVDSTDGDVINVLNNILMLENYSLGYINKPLLSSGGTLRCVGNAFTWTSPISNPGGLTLDCSVTLTLQGTITGAGSLTKMGTSTAVITATDSTWAGSTTIAAGTLQIGSGTGDGSLPDIPMTDNGTLSFNTSLNFTNTQPITGTGTMTKFGDGELTLNTSNSFTGSFTAGNGTPTSGGIIRLLNNYGFGNGNKNVTICRAELRLEGGMDVPTNFTFLTSANSDIVGAGGGYFALRNIAGNNTIEGNIILTSGGGSSEFHVDAGQLTLNGSITPNTTGRALILSGTSPGIINGPITNNGGNVPTLEKRDAGTWTLNASNDFTGSTTLKGGTLLLGAAGSLDRTVSIEVQSNATFNVAAVAAYSVKSNQTLLGNGTVSGNTTIYGTLYLSNVDTTVLADKFTFANNLVLTGTNIMRVDRVNVPSSDLVAAASVTYGGTLIVTNIADPLQSGDTFNLYDASAFSGGFTATILPPLDPSLQWDLSKLNVDGTIQVVTGSASSPTNITWGVSGNSLGLSWPASYIGWNLMTQTNNLANGVSLNPADWGIVPGSASTNQVFIPLSTGTPAGFYRMQKP